MVNPWLKYKKASKRQQQALRSLFAGLVLFAFFYFITAVYKIPLCPIKNILGISCFGCGITRGIISILRLDFRSAIYSHILSIPIFIGIVIYALLCITDIIFERNDLERISRKCGRKYMFVLYLIILILSLFINRSIRQ